MPHFKAMRWIGVGTSKDDVGFSIAAAGQSAPDKEAFTYVIAEMPSGEEKICKIPKRVYYICDGAVA